MRSIAAFAFVLVVGCQGKEGKSIDQAAGSSATATPNKPALSAGGSADFDAAIIDLEKYREKMCACADVPCIDQVFKDFTAWRQDFRKSNSPSSKPTPEQDRKANDINRQLMICKTKISGIAGKAVGSGSGSAVGSAAVPKDPVEAALVELDGFKTKMCACKDKPCGDKLQLEYAEWGRNLRAKMVEKPNKLQEVRGNALEKEMKECRKKAETATPGAAGSTSKLDSFLTQMQGYRDKIRACPAKDCAVTLRKELETWLTSAAKDIADAKPTKDQDDKADRLEKEMTGCISKLK